jgi:4-hydroxybenzoate polyprenyltransferase
MSIKTYLQLVRLPNLFTAAADSLAGWLLVGGSLAEPRGWLALTLASVGIYAGGVVLNDVFDAEVDRRERPERPIPSGRVSRGGAAALGIALQALGMLLAVASGTRHGATLAALLVGCVLAYDAGLKHTPLGPEVMGACRGLNLLLGASLSTQLGGPLVWTAAGAYALFVTGITWISRSEVDAGPWKNVLAGFVLQNVAVLGLVGVCVGMASAGGQETASGLAPGGVAVLLAIGLRVDARTIRAIRTPSPDLVRLAVKAGILSLVWLHVGLVLAARGPMPAVAVGLLSVPANLAARWIYAT